MVINLTHIFLTYIKIHPETGKLYIGRTSGWVEEITLKSITKILRKRDTSHQKNKEGYGNAVIDQFSTNSDAIRGREDIKINESKTNGTSGNIYRGISPKNKKRQQYINAALRTFGDLTLTAIGYYWFYL